MKKISSKIETLIIGAGPSGLACAIQCHNNNKPFLLIEQSDRVGGRVGSFEEDGFIFDLGFQVYNTAYEVTNSLLDIDAIGLNNFRPGAMIHDGTSFQIISDPLRDISQAFATLFSDISTISDKIRVLRLKSSLKGYEINKDSETDIDTHKFLSNQGFSERMIEMFFRPFFSGIFLENKLETSSKFFKYVFSTFNTGLASLPDKGMQSIPNDLLKRIDSEKVLFDKRVVKIDQEKNVHFEDGSSLGAKNVVLTGGTTNISAESPKEYNSAKTIYFCSKVTPLKGNYIHLYPCDEIINNIAIPTSISSVYSKNGDHLYSVTVMNNDMSKIDLIDSIQGKLSDYYGGVKSDYEYLKYLEIKKGTLKQMPGYFYDSVKNENGIIYSGESQVNGSIEGAVISGIEAANLI
tara:strand:+ start:605 stop:1822 length:1218 start_codon:yes stop_codon:yes gene_type:complete